MIWKVKKLSFWHYEQCKWLVNTWFLTIELKFKNHKCSRLILKCIFRIRVQWSVKLNSYWENDSFLLSSSCFFYLGEKDVEWTGLKFSPDGKTILISTNGSLIRLIDAFNGKLMQTFTGHVNTKAIPLEASFSPDSQFVISGSTDGRVHIWNAENGTKVQKQHI